MRCSTWIRTFVCAAGIGAPSCCGSARTATTGIPSSKSASLRRTIRPKSRPERSTTKDTKDTKGRPLKVFLHVLGVLCGFNSQLLPDRLNLGVGLGKGAIGPDHEISPGGLLFRRHLCRQPLA